MLLNGMKRGIEQVPENLVKKIGFSIQSDIQICLQDETYNQQVKLSQLLLNEAA
jgi:hypothetical protein